jgi:hypothetical protein
MKLFIKLLSVFLVFNGAHELFADPTSDYLAVVKGSKSVEVTELISNLGSGVVNLTISPTGVLTQLTLNGGSELGRIGATGETMQIDTIPVNSTLTDVIGTISYSYDESVNNGMNALNPAAPVMASWTIIPGSYVDGDTGQQTLLLGVSGARTVFSPYSYNLVRLMWLALPQQYL